MNKFVALVIEDNDMLNRLYAEALGEAGFQIETAVDGRMALEKLHTLVPDLIFLDLHLPHISGDELLAYIRSDTRFQHTRIIVGSADGSWANYLNQEVDFVLNKPISYKQLRTLGIRILSTIESKP